jgi:aspartyl/asparaginyl beta-hydroxylase (cupin superfamily)
MELKELKNHWKTIREELEQLPSVFISEEPRPTGEWEGSELIKKIVSQYSSGKYGWLKGGQTHVQDDWISWPLIWEGKPVLGNCLKCLETYELLSQIKGIQIAGFSLMKGGVKLKEHVDPVGERYRFTYHLGLKCPKGCFLHHKTLGDIEEEDGKHIVLNARYPHWAENTSQEDRVILYIEFYTPKITLQ